jgi:hypothetical protein
VKVELSALEQRVLGCLVEKQLTTPEQYPMSLNALTNACNQKSNRDPVLALPETEVQALIDGLSRKHLVLERSGFGSRVPKYQQRFCNTEFSVFQFTPQERAIVCELLLRGAQTPGELRSRAARMAEFTGAAPGARARPARSPLCAPVRHRCIGTAGVGRRHAVGHCRARQPCRACRDRCRRARRIADARARRGR